MSLFDLTNLSDPIDDKFLQSMGFTKTWWGSPCGKNKKENQFYESSTKNGIVSIYYFPDTFKGYVNARSLNTYHPKNKILCISNIVYDKWEYVQDAIAKIDIISTINLCKQYEDENSSKLWISVDCV